MIDDKVQFKDVFTGFDICNSLDIEGVTDKTSLNPILFSMCNERFISPIVGYYLKDNKLTNEDVSSICGLINSRFSSKWHGMFETLALKYDVLYSNVTERTETKNSEALNKTYGIDSDEGVNDNSNTYTENNTYKTKNGNNVNSNSLKTEIDFRNNDDYNYIVTVFNDVKDFLTINIY